MDLAAGSDPFDDLLAEVAALLEMYRVHKLGFLNQMCFAEVDTEAGLAVNNAGGLGLGEGDFGGSGEEESLADDRRIKRRDENPIAGLAGIVSFDDETAGPRERVEFGCGEGNFGGGEDFGGVGAFDS